MHPSIGIKRLPVHGTITAWRNSHFYVSATSNSSPGEFDLSARQANRAAPRSEAVLSSLVNNQKGKSKSYFGL